jgi:phosphotransferase system  glucose/maltose/N-acetylglucosamine-specific IIC component
MELLILGGLALMLMLAAVANRGEPEVETFVITMPVQRHGRNPLVPMVVAILTLLLITVLIDRVGGWLGM